MTTKKFVNLTLASLFDRIDSCLPPCVPVEETFDTFGPNDTLSDFAYGCMSQAAMVLSCIAADVCGDGVGASDIVDALDLEEVILGFKFARLKDPNVPEPSSDMLTTLFFQTYKKQK